MSFFKYNGSGIPKDIRWYFSVDRISKGEKKDIILIFNNKRYPAYIQCELLELARTRMFWTNDLGIMFRSLFSDYEISSSDSFPFIIFEKTDIDEYRVLFIESDVSTISTDAGNLSMGALDLETQVNVIGDREGKKTLYYTYKYERSPKNRAAAMKIHGTKCMACGFDFESKYGELGKDFIEVHHTVPLHSRDEEVDVNPKTDLICVCSNCHRMIHRKKGVVLSLVELKRIIRK